MNKIDKKGIAALCDALTQNGETLEIKWSGGGDDGLFEMLRDGKPFDYGSPAIQSVIEMVENEIGYGGFDGNFSAEGRVEYNRELRAFEGEDTYSESDADMAECSITIRIPREIWFDRLNILINSEYSSSSVTTRLQVMNGPRVDQHQLVEEYLDERISRAIDEVLEAVEDVDGASDEITINFSEFSLSDTEAVFTIKEFSYSYYKKDTKDIIIYLTENLNDNDSI